MGRAIQGIEAALTWSEDPRGITRQVLLDQPGEGFGLLEPSGAGWTLCIPDGSIATALVDGCPIDLSPLPVEPSGERRLTVRPGLSAKILMGSFAFSVRSA